MQLVHIKHPAEFHFSALLPKTGKLTPREKALNDLGDAIDLLWRKVPYFVQDFLLRTARMMGLPIDYPSFPFWVERAARHLIFILYPTLKKSNLAKPTTEDFGRVSGHMLAFILHARQGTAIFARLSGESAEQVKQLFLHIEGPVRVLVNEGLSLPPDESGPFLKGLNHAFSKTFDGTGMPTGWNTNSPVLLGICWTWRVIATKSPSLPELHQGLVKLLGDEQKPGKGEQIVGSEDRLKKICHRIGLRFSGNRAIDREGTAVILDVPSETKMISNK